MRYQTVSSGVAEATGVDTKLALTAHSVQVLGKRKKRSMNAERDMHRTFCRAGLSLPVKVDEVVHHLAGGSTTTHCIQPSSWLKVLLRKSPHVLFGDGDPSDQCASFWACYRFEEPTHAVFRLRSQEELKQTVPLLVFGDEGRGPKRGNFLVWSVESPIGLTSLGPGDVCSCSEDLSALPYFDVVSEQSVGHIPDDLLEAARKMTTNYKGHSFLTKHLLFGLPFWQYKGENADVVKKTFAATTRRSIPPARAWH